MDFNLNAVVAEATGHYTNQDHAGICFIPAGFEYWEEAKTFDFTFSEIDGKHSETQANVTTEAEGADIFSWLPDTESSNWNEQVVESLLGHIEDQSDISEEDFVALCDQINEFNAYIHKNVSYKVVTKTVFKFAGAIVDV